MKLRQDTPATRRAILGGSSTTLVIAVGGNHHHRQIGVPLLDFRQEFQAIHLRHIDVGEDGNQCGLDVSRKPI